MEQKRPACRWTITMRRACAAVACALVAAGAHAATATDDAAAATRGKSAIARFGCAACHAIPGIAAPPARVGPPLEKIGTRAYIAGVLPNTREAMVRWLMNPPGVDPLTAMPDLHLTEAQAQDIAAYLNTLR